MRVTINYFKKTGKWYSKEEMETGLTDYYGIINSVRNMQYLGKLPGLVDGGGKEFIIEVTPHQGEYNIPHLIFPEENI
jgi:hypothetical protein